MKKSVTKCTMEQALEVLAPYSNASLISIDESDVKQMFDEGKDVEFATFEVEKVEDLSQIKLSEELEREQLSQAIIHATHPLGVDIPAATIAALMGDVLQKHKSVRINWGLCESEQAEAITLRAFTS